MSIGIIFQHFWLDQTGPLEQEAHRNTEQLIEKLDKDVHTMAFDISVTPILEKIKNLPLPPYFIIKNKGLFENSSAIPAAKEMMDCFLEVLLKVDLSNSLKFLSSEQENELLNWDVEKYRQSIN